MLKSIAIMMNLIPRYYTGRVRCTVAPLNQSQLISSWTMFSAGETDLCVSINCYVKFSMR